MPQVTVAEGYTVEVAAASPLVQHPIMGYLDDRGRLYVGDAAGVNLKKDELEKQRPNRVLMLEDADHDGRFEKRSVFADQMTFPQGACWLAGSLYVCSPPSLWRLTDTDDDGVADKREELVTGFDYTGNAADIHGPFLHPNGRLYWCHGRKGHKVQRVTMVSGQRVLGEVVHEGMACGIWSCKPDGSEVAWHSLGCGDNPVEVDFSPEGDILGVQNLYFNQPRGDTLVHWLYGGIYERADQLQAIAGLPRTLAQMPVVYNFGHVAVSGCCLAKVGQVAGPLQMYVTHFNTQRVVRVELLPEGASYKATEHEFLKLHDPDIHLTDVMEDKDGSLLVIDTGGWFRSGCPASMMEKPDVLGAVYRVRKQGVGGGNESPTRPAFASRLRSTSKATGEWVAQLSASDLRHVFLACQALDQLPSVPEGCEPALRKVLSRELDAPTEHAAMHLAYHVFKEVQSLEKTMSPMLLRRLLVINSHTAANNPDHRLGGSHAEDYLDAADEALARAAFEIVKASPLAGSCADRLTAWLKQPAVSRERLRALALYTQAMGNEASSQALVTAMLGHGSVAVQEAALRVIAGGAFSATTSVAWGELVEAMLHGATARSGTSEARLPILLDAIAELKSARFDAALQGIASDEARAVTLRLKALGALSTSGAGKLDDSTFALLSKLLADPANATARITAAEMLGHARLSDEQLPRVLETVPMLGPLELGSLLSGFKKYKPEQGKAIALGLSKSPVLGSLQESLFRTVFSGWPEEVFHLLRPAITAAEAATDAKKAKLEALSIKAVKGDAAAGRKLFETGMGTCIACHKIGEIGRAIGPDLSKIGAIRLERDLLESILFPSNTLARDYEMHAIEMSDGQSLLGIIKSHTAEGLLLVDGVGQEKTVRHEQVVADATLALSLMPMGLDATLSEAQLLDLVAYLRGLR